MEDGSNQIDGGHLRAFIERIEKLGEEKCAIADDIKSIYAEAKGTGFDPKIMRKIVAMRRIDKAKREEEYEILDLYLSALGMLQDTPLGEAALRAAGFKQTGPLQFDVSGDFLEKEERE